MNIRQLRKSDGRCFSAVDFTEKKLQKNMCSLIRFAATVHLQKPRITNSSEKMCTIHNLPLIGKNRIYSNKTFF